MIFIPPGRSGGYQLTPGRAHACLRLAYDPGRLGTAVVGLFIAPRHRSHPLGGLEPVAGNQGCGTLPRCGGTPRGLCGDAGLTAAGVGPSTAKSPVSEGVTSVAAQAMHARRVPPTDA